MHKEEKINSELKYEGHILDVYCDTVVLEDGKNAFRDVIRHKGAVCVAPITDKGEFIFVKQYRYPIGRETIELPAGKLDSLNENPLDCAKRELKEETGCDAKEFIYAGIYCPSPAYTDEKVYLYIAKGLSYGKTDFDDDEFIDSEKISIQDAVNLVTDNKIEDGKTEALILKTYYLLNNERKDT